MTNTTKPSGTNSTKPLDSLTFFTDQDTSCEAIIIHSRRLATGALPPLPSPKCPACGNEQTDVYSSGLWDGHDVAGRGIGGSCELGTCKSCGVHYDFHDWWDKDKKQWQFENRVLTEDEWQQRIVPHEKIKRQTENWPFISTD
jgi:hypothetical protein